MTKYHLNGVLETTKLVLESTVTQLLDLWARSQKGVLVRFGAFWGAHAKRGQTQIWGCREMSPYLAVGRPGSYIYLMG